MSGALSYIQRLKENQEHKIKSCLERINEFEKLLEDYEALKSRLQTIPDKLSYDVMVPMNDMAFMPGFLTHTNEIFVLLGDNWFVERSAKQAVSIVERRLQSCQKMLENLQKEKQQYSDWMAFTSEVQGNENLVEIIEEYDPEKEKAWNEQHKKNLKKLRKETEQSSIKDDINQKIEKLQLQEENSEDLESRLISSKADGDVRIRQVKWQDEVDEQAKIHVTYSSQPLHVAEHEYEEESADDAVIQSPADIYKQFSVEPPEPKSILKNKSATVNVVKVTETENREERNQLECAMPTVQAFSGEIFERNVSNSSQVTEKLPRPTSRFKAGRNKK